MKRLICMLCVLGLITSTGLVNAANYTAPQPRPPLRPPAKAKEAEETTDYYKMKDVSINNKQYFYANKTLAEIESHSDIIIEGKPTGDSKQVLEYFTDSQYIFSGYMLSKIKIEKVYKGDIHIDDIITVAEAYYIQDNTIYHDSLYYPSAEDKSYIWFLVDVRPHYDHYAVVRLERGRFPVLNADTRSANQLDSLSRQDLNLSPSGEAKDEEIYRDILKEVVAKYMNGSAE